jgi:Papain-like cysteine protease AvrRpt2
MSGHRAKALVGAFLLLGALSALGQKPVTVGIPTAQFNFVSATQLHADWCWAASVQMVLNWYNIPVQQSDVVKRIYGRLVDAAASEDEIAVALSGTAYDRRNHMVHLVSAWWRGVPSAGLMVTELGEKHPLLVTFHSTRTMLHAVVLTSAEYFTDAQGIHLTALTFRDPNPTFQERRTAESYRVTGAEMQRFLRAISSYYLVSVQS